MMLVGTEIKSIKNGNANLSDAYCIFKGKELFLKSAFISEYKYGNQQNHVERRGPEAVVKKKQELKKLKKKNWMKKGLAIVPLQIVVNDRGFAKIMIALAKRKKKAYDKRASIRDKDQKNEI